MTGRGLAVWFVVGLAMIARLEAGTISGTVTGPGGGPLADIWVGAYRVDGGWEHTGDAITDGAGAYAITGLPTGSYLIEFWSGGDYVDEWYDNAINSGEAHELQLTAGGFIGNINAQMEPATRISGRVTDTGGNPLEDIVAWVLLWHDGQWANWSRGSSTDANGEYDVGGIPAGTYAVWFEDRNGDYAQQWFDQVRDRGDAQMVTGPAGGTVADIDAVLVPGSSISGTVSGPGGEPLEGAQVEAYRQRDLVSAAFTRADADGNYTLRGLAEGAHLIYFSVYGETFEEQWYNEADNSYDALPVVLAPGQHVAGINGSLTGASVGSGSISGTVTDPDGNPLEGIDVDVFRGPNYNSYNTTQTDATGFYRQANLSAGDYKVRFRAPDETYRAIFWDSQANLDDADVIPVGEGEWIENIDAILSPATVIGGTVTDADGNPLDGLVVYAYRWDDSQWNYAGACWTDAAGRYAIGNLAGGTYIVEVQDYHNSDYVRQYYDGAADEAGATPIVLAEGQQRHDIDFVMAEAPLNGIAGVVTASEAYGGQPIGGVTVTAYAFDGENWVYALHGQTDSEGFYQVRPLAPGIYRVGFHPNPYSGYLTQFYDQAASVLDGEDVEVVEGVLTEGINAVLGDSGGGGGDDGSISGTVTDQGGNPLADVEVNVYSDRGWFLDGTRWQLLEQTATDEDGNYACTVPAGSYRVGFHDPSGDHIYGVYDGMFHLDDGLDVDVASGEQVNNVDMTLAKAAKISGRITGPDGSTPVAGARVEAYWWTEDGWQLPPRQPLHGWFIFFLSDANGYYTINGLPAGDYRVVVNGFTSYDGDMVFEFVSRVYPGAVTLDDGTDVPVPAQTVVTGIDVMLPWASWISGCVTGPDGVAPLEGIEVRAFRRNDAVWQPERLRTTDADGRFLIGGLDPGTYRVGFEHFFGMYAAAVYAHALEIESGTDIVLSAETTVNGIDISMRRQYSGGDANGNGIPDDWEIEMFGSLDAVTADSDWDEDGFPDEFEFRAGTDPRSPDSFLGITRDARMASGSELEIRWLSSAGKFYALERRAHLTEGDWETVRAYIPATPPVNTATDPDISGGARWFYRVRLEE